MGPKRRVISGYASVRSRKPTPNPASGHIPYTQSQSQQSRPVGNASGGAQSGSTYQNGMRVGQGGFGGGGTQGMVLAPAPPQAQVRVAIPPVGHSRPVAGTSTQQQQQQQWQQQQQQQQGNRQISSNATQHRYNSSQSIHQHQQPPQQQQQQPQPQSRRAQAQHGMGGQNTRTVTFQSQTQSTQDSRHGAANQSSSNPNQPRPPTTAPIPPMPQTHSSIGPMYTQAPLTAGTQNTTSVAPAPRPRPTINGEEVPSNEALAAMSVQELQDLSKRMIERLQQFQASEAALTLTANEKEGRIALLKSRMNSQDRVMFRLKTEIGELTKEKAKLKDKHSLEAVKQMQSLKDELEFKEHELQGEKQARIQLDKRLKTEQGAIKELRRELAAARTARTVPLSSQPSPARAPPGAAGGGGGGGAQASQGVGRAGLSSQRMTPAKPHGAIVTAPPSSSRMPSSSQQPTRGGGRPPTSGPSPAKGKRAQSGTSGTGTGFASEFADFDQPSTRKRRLNLHSTASGASAVTGGPSSSQGDVGAQRSQTTAARARRGRTSTRLRAPDRQGSAAGAGATTTSLTQEGAGFADGPDSDSLPVYDEGYSGVGAAMTVWSSDDAGEHADADNVSTHVVAGQTDAGTGAHAGGRMDQHSSGHDHMVQIGLANLLFGDEESHRAVFYLLSGGQSSQGTGNSAGGLTGTGAGAGAGFDPPSFGAFHSPSKYGPGDSDGYETPGRPLRPLGRSATASSVASGLGLGGAEFQAVSQALQRTLAGVLSGTCPPGLLLSQLEAYIHEAPNSAAFKSGLLVLRALILSSADIRESIARDLNKGDTLGTGGPSEHERYGSTCSYNGEEYTYVPGSSDLFATELGNMGNEGEWDDVGHDIHTGKGISVDDTPGNGIHTYLALHHGDDHHHHHHHPHHHHHHHGVGGGTGGGVGSSSRRKGTDRRHSTRSGNGTSTTNGGTSGQLLYLGAESSLGLSSEATSVASRFQAPAHVSMLWSYLVNPIRPPISPSVSGAYFQVLLAMLTAPHSAFGMSQFKYLFQRDIFESVLSDWTSVGDHVHILACQVLAQLFEHRCLITVIRNATTSTLLDTLDHVFTNSKNAEVKLAALQALCVIATSHLDGADILLRKHLENIPNHIPAAICPRLALVIDEQSAHISAWLSQWHNNDCIGEKHADVVRAPLPKNILVSTCILNQSLFLLNILALRVSLPDELEGFARAYLLTGTDRVLQSSGRQAQVLFRHARVLACNIRERLGFLHAPPFVPTEQQRTQDSSQG